LLYSVSFRQKAQYHRQTDDIMMPIADHSACTTIGLKLRGNWLSSVYLVRVS